MTSRPKSKSTSKSKSKAKPNGPKRATAAILNAITKPLTPYPTTTPPSRVHPSSYHYPLLLDHVASSDALLSWFAGIEEKRSMPWRKVWIDPERFEGSNDELDEVLATRAYEVWVSEIMLQQTRVSTVIPYFNTWISKWPTIHSLATASHDDVLAAWKGLGYYSRATRLHQGAQAMASQNPSGCPIPRKAEDLMKFPGIGRYTAGAVSSIAFGEAEPVLDGNVVRVLSRQLGIFADGKDKKVNDALWEVADLLVKSVAVGTGKGRSKVPGQWNQAVMELGSTVCTPRPKCDECPIQRTCRAYAEGKVLGGKKGMDIKVPDIEDACTLCEQLDTEDLVTAAEQDEEEEVSEKQSKKRKVEAKVTNTISQYFAVKTPKRKTTTDTDIEDDTEVDVSASNGAKRKSPATDTTSKSVITYCSLFPKKIPKKKPAEEECLVCIIELQSPSTSKWLIEQRPAKGLLASLWQFPQHPLPTTPASDTPGTRKSSAQKCISSLDIGDVDMREATHVAELGNLVHVFSHLRLTMHVQHFRISQDKETTKQRPRENTTPGLPARKWVDTDAMDGETLSTGMRRCWGLVVQNSV
ncbi:DNA glycosylase [Lentithecium fluviatile CBS 122367]|uniref:Adenine DNA glycosylase n=1 Tax=Lentithecium fluviatile CBS 122367 TaxID=1168545 RepID=A0A6G1J104_9PLEO|nr:DNA glycosylase [Lentithecium fluviatile CBS 122367]